MEQVGEDFGTNKESLLYCGGYYISDWERDKQIVMTKSEEHWDKDKITLKALNFEAVADGISGVELFQRGQIATTSLTSEELSQHQVYGVGRLRLPFRQDADHLLVHLQLQVQEPGVSRRPCRI
ncbi:MAG: ABC transporter substrate-binding protein [Bacillota bacterium]